VTRYFSDLKDSGPYIFLLTRTNFIVADSQPITKPEKINVKSFNSGVPLSLHLMKNTIAQAKKIAILYIAHDLYDLLIA
jgi:hypothetical protein